MLPLGVPHALEVTHLATSRGLPSSGFDRFAAQDDNLSTITTGH